MMSPPAPAAEPRWQAFQNRSFRLYWLSRFSSNFAVQLLSVAVGWHVYDLTRRPLDLGLVGLAQFLPALLLVLVTGAASDRYSRRSIMGLCLVGESLCALVLLALVARGLNSVLPIFGLLVLFGIARAFFNPASTSLVANIVPPQHLANAIALNSSTWQVATITGPIAGGLLYGLAPEAAYATALLIFTISAVAIMAIPKPDQKTHPEPARWNTLVAGFRYVWTEKIVLGAISLDLFAVLLGGATALMPVYARDILVLGPVGLGLLRAAPGVGAVATALYLAGNPVRDHAGIVLLVCVAGYGLFTFIFGVSTLVWLSIAALALMGACDMISVYIRETLIQLWTPDAVRGRVNAINMVFVGASNELGEFRAGVMAALIGTVAAVSLGGAGAIAVAAAWGKWFPDLRRARHLQGRV
jgi:MFS family permease